MNDGQSPSSCGNDLTLPNGSSVFDILFGFTSNDNNREAHTLC